MNRRLVVGAACLLAAAAGSPLQAAQPQSAAAAEHQSRVLLPPAWAYPLNPPDFHEIEAQDVVLHVPDSRRTFRPAQLKDLFQAPDWHPEDHPAIPRVVARGRKPGVWACGYCHLPDGAGRPENAALAGLPAAYIVQQLEDFKSGTRGTAVPQRVPPKLMIELSRSLRPADIDAAAAYFSRLPPRSARLRVIETDSVPGTYVAGWFLAVNKSAPSEPIGRRIIEVPADLAQFERRDARSRFLAYVPIGSIRSGEALVMTGGTGKTLACTGCHGADLRGLGAAPGIAGRSPSYIVRQLFDMQSGARTGPDVATMSALTAHLGMDEMIAIAAYLASLN